MISLKKLKNWDLAHIRFSHHNERSTERFENFFIINRKMYKCEKGIIGTKKLFIKRRRYGKCKKF
jgi:hypothetical protein